MSSISLLGFKKRRTISGIEEEELLAEDVASDLTPRDDSTWSLGTALKRWLNAYIVNLYVVNAVFSGLAVMPAADATTDLGDGTTASWKRLFLTSYISTTSSNLARYNNNTKTLLFSFSPSALGVGGDGWEVRSQKTLNVPTDYNAATDTIVLVNHLQTLANKTINAFITGASRAITCVDPGAASNLYFMQAPSDQAIVFDQGPVATPTDANQTWRFERLGGTNEVKVTIPKKVLAAGGTTPFRTTAITAALRPATSQRKTISVIDNSASDGSNCFVGSIEVQSSGVIYIGTSTNISAYTNANNLGWGSNVFTYYLGDTLTVV